MKKILSIVLMLSMAMFVFSGCSNYNIEDSKIDLSGKVNVDGVEGSVDVAADLEKEAVNGELNIDGEKYSLNAGKNSALEEKASEEAFRNEMDNNIATQLPTVLNNGFVKTLSKYREEDEGLIFITEYINPQNNEEKLTFKILNIDSENMEMFQKEIQEHEDSRFFTYNNKQIYGDGHDDWFILVKNDKYVNLIFLNDNEEIMKETEVLNFLTSKYDTIELDGIKEKTAAAASGGVVIDTVIKTENGPVIYVINKGTTTEHVKGSIDGCNTSNSVDVEADKTKAIDIDCSENKLIEGNKYTAIITVEEKGTKRYTFIYN